MAYPQPTSNNTFGQQGSMPPNSMYQQPGAMGFLPSNTQSYPQPGYSPPGQPNSNWQGTPPQHLPQQNPSPPLVSLTPDEEQQFQVLRRFRHILHLPMFSLCEAQDTENLRRQEEFRQEIFNSITPTQKLIISEKIMLRGLSTATGADFINPDKIMNGIVAFGAMAMAIGTSENILTILSRWVSPPESTCPPIIVDVLQSYTPKFSVNRSVITVRTNRDSKLIVNGKHDKKCKTKKYWMASLKTALVSIAVVDENKQQFPLESPLLFSTHFTR